MAKCKSCVQNLADKLLSHHSKLTKERATYLAEKALIRYEARREKEEQQTISRFKELKEIFFSDPIRKVGSIALTITEKTNYISLLETNPNWMKPNYYKLMEDGLEWMGTSWFELREMDYYANKCPLNAKVYVGGLGLGLFLINLAKSGKTREVIVAEKSQDVIQLIEPKLRKWLSKHYPKFKWKVIQGDVFEVVKGELYDYIFIDTLPYNPITSFLLEDYKEQRRIVEQYLTENGIVNIAPEEGMQLAERYYSIVGRYPKGSGNFGIRGDNITEVELELLKQHFNEFKFTLEGSNNKRHNWIGTKGKFTLRFWTIPISDLPTHHSCGGTKNCDGCTALKQNCDACNAACGICVWSGRFSRCDPTNGDCSTCATEQDCSTICSCAGCEWEAGPIYVDVTLALLYAIKEYMPKELGLDYSIVTSGEVVRYLILDHSVGAFFSRILELKNNVRSTLDVTIDLLNAIGKYLSISIDLLHRLKTYVSKKLDVLYSFFKKYMESEISASSCPKICDGLLATGEPHDNTAWYLEPYYLVYYNDASSSLYTAVSTNRVDWSYQTLDVAGTIEYLNTEMREIDSTIYLHHLASKTDGDIVYFRGIWDDGSITDITDLSTISSGTNQLGKGVGGITTDESNYPYMLYRDSVNTYFTKSATNDGTFSHDDGFPMTLPNSVPNTMRSCIMENTSGDTILNIWSTNHGANEFNVYYNLWDGSSLDMAETMTFMVYEENDICHSKRNDTITLIYYPGGNLNLDGGWGRQRKYDCVNNTWTPETNIWSRYVLQPHLSQVSDDILYAFYMANNRGYQQMYTLSTDSWAEAKICSCTGMPVAEFYFTSSSDSNVAFAVIERLGELYLSPMMFKMQTRLTMVYHVGIILVTKFLELLHIVRNTIQSSVSLRYTLNSYVSKVLGIRYNIYSYLQRILDLLYNVKSYVSTDLDLKYTLLSYVSKSLGILYTVNQYLQKSLTSLYRVKEYLSTSISIPYKILSYVVKDLVNKYNVKAYMQTVLSIPYNVGAYVAEKALSLKYALLNYVPKDLSLDYTINSLREKLLTVKYNVSGYLQKSLDVLYNVGAYVADKTLSIPYKLLTYVSKDLVEVYTINAFTEKLLSIAYNVTAYVQDKALSIPYNVSKYLSRNLVSVYKIKSLLDKALVIVYDLSGALVKTLTIVYNSLAYLPRALSLKYNVSSYLQRLLSLRYNVASYFERTLDLLYRVKTYVSDKVLGILYDIRGSLSKVLYIRYTVISYLQRLLTLNYDLGGALFRLFSLAYNSASYMTTSLDIKYNVKAFLSKLLSIRYVLARYFSRLLSIPYNVSTYLSTQLSLQYDIKSFVEKVLGIPYNMYSYLQRSLTILYDIGLFYVSKALSINYINNAYTLLTMVLSNKLSAYLSKLLTIPYNVGAYLQRALTIVYDVLTGITITKTLILKYVSATYSTINMVLQYNVKSYLSKALTTLYTIKQYIIKSVSLPYMIKGYLSKLLTIDYGIIAQYIISKVLSLTYNIKTYLSTSLISLNRIKSYLTRENVLTYNLKAYLERTLSPVYNIRSYVVKPLTILYHANINFLTKVLVMEYESIGTIFYFIINLINRSPKVELRLRQNIINLKKRTLITKLIDKLRRGGS